MICALYITVRNACALLCYSYVIAVLSMLFPCLICFVLGKLAVCACLNHTCADVLTVVHFCVTLMFFENCKCIREKVLEYREGDHIYTCEQIKVPNIYNFTLQKNEVLKFSCEL